MPLIRVFHAYEGDDVRVRFTSVTPPHVGEEYEVKVKPPKRSPRPPRCPRCAAPLHELLGDESMSSLAESNS